MFTSVDLDFACLGLVCIGCCVISFVVLDGCAGFVWHLLLFVL